MDTIKGFWQHTKTGDIYAVESTALGEVIGGVGPLKANELIDLNDYDYKQDINKFLQEAIARNRLRKYTPRYKA